MTKDKITTDDIQIFIMTHNRKNYLKQAIDSILNQTAHVNTITVLDNESTDGTEEFIKSYYDQKVQYVYTKGFLGNYYKAKELIHGKYCMLFHDDDILHPDYLKIVLEMLNRYENVSLLTTKYLAFYDNDVPNSFKKANKQHYLFNNQYEFTKYMYFVEKISYSPAIYRSKDFLKIDLEYDKYSKFNDWPLMIKMSSFGKTIYLNDNNLMHARLHQRQDSMTTVNTLSVEQIVNWVKVFYDILKCTQDKKFLTYLLAKARFFIEGHYRNYLDEKIKQNITTSQCFDIAQKLGLPGIQEADKKILETKEYRTFVENIENSCLSHSIRGRISSFYSICCNKVFHKKFDEKYWKKYFQKHNEQKFIDQLASDLQGKKVLLYGYGMIAQHLFKYYDLSKLNIVAIADSKFEKTKVENVQNYKALEPMKINNVNFDAVIVAIYYNTPVYILVNKLNIDKPVKSIIAK